MKHIPTTQDLTNLADSIARDGVAAHAEGLDQLAQAADRAGLFPASVAVLSDADAAPDQKARAFMTLHHNWHTIVHAVTAKINFDAAFEALREQWLDHEALRFTGDVAALWASRSQLDARRVEAASAGSKR